MLNSLLCRASSEEESEWITSSLKECLGHVKVRTSAAVVELCTHFNVAYQLLNTYKYMEIIVY